MPSGWLAIRPGGGIRTASRIPEYDGQQQYNPCNSSSGAFNPYDFGATELYSRPVPNSNMHQWVCRWPQYAVPANQPGDGWYYAVPWRSERQGAPRDMYLKLETINYDDLVARYAPVLLYDSDEEFDALSPGAMTDFFDAGSLLLDDSNSIRDSATFAIADPRYVGQAPGYLSQLNLDFLGPIYGDPIETDGRREGTSAEATDYVSARGEVFDDIYADDAATMAAQDEYGNRVYARIAHGADSQVWVQYWLFYYFNSLVPVHEGDWEMIQVGLNEVTHSAEGAVYAQHGDGQWCPWTSVEKVGDKPVVYVARHSHASYFHVVLEGESTDVADGQGGPRSGAEDRADSFDFSELGRLDREVGRFGGQPLGRFGGKSQRSGTRRKHRGMEPSWALDR